MEDLLPLFYCQLKCGCDLLSCTNPNCASNPNFRLSQIVPDVADADVDIAGITLANRYEEGERNLLCRTLSPLLLEPQTYASKIWSLRNFASQFMAGRATEPISVFTDWRAFCYFLVSGDGLLRRGDLQIDGHLCKEFYESVRGRPAFFKSEEKAFNNLIELFATGQLPETLFRLRGFLIIFLFSPLLDPVRDAERFRSVLEGILRLSAQGTSIIFTALVQNVELIEILLRTVQAMTTGYIQAQPRDPHSQPLHVLASFIEFLAEANASSRARLPPEAFVNQALNGLVIAVNEYKLITRDIFSYMDTPAVLDPVIKTQMLKKESKLAGQLRLPVRRDRVLQMQEWLHMRPGELLKSLSIQFEGEIAQDEGGVSREFFMLAGIELLERGDLFRQVNENTYHWFKPNSEMELSQQNQMKCAGLLTRLALMNGIQLPFRFPAVVYKKLRAEPLSEVDYAEVFPEEAGNLASLRNDGVNLDDVGLTFTITEFDGHRPIDVPLVTGRPDMPVTRANVNEYIMAYAQYRLVRSVATGFQWFWEGFILSGETRVMSKLPSYDFVLLVSGSGVLDWEELKESTTYQGYDRNSPAIVLFWAVFDTLSDEEKLKMLQFATGTYRAPIGGFKTLNFKIRRMANQRALPVAHTCLLTLDLPDCLDEGRVYDNMRICVENCEGFGFV
jgi:hypothetical protein